MLSERIFGREYDIATRIQAQAEIIREASIADPRYL